MSRSRSPPSLPSPADLKLALDALASTNPSTYQTTLLGHWLGPTFPIALTRPLSTLLRDAIIVALDVEWYEHSPTHITELGVSILDPRFISRTPPSSPPPLQKTTTHHVRLRPNAHLTNSDLCPGYPQNFQFGPTAFVSRTEATTLLRHAFTRYNQYNTLRPVILMGHAVDGDAGILKEGFGVDVEGMGVLVSTLDSQVLAFENGIVGAGRKVGLGALMGVFGVREGCLHNAGNDVLCTVLAGLLCVGMHAVGFTQRHYEELKFQLRGSAKSIYGTPNSCIKCDSSVHTEDACQVTLHCSICATHKSATRRQAAYTHSTLKCKEDVKEKGKLLPVPCIYCIVSMDPARYAVGNSYRHGEGQCAYEKRGDEGGLEG
ncbi:hypothetical protein T440DRAFT_400911 [Plenodomus tracheiphilus IPT5]|uniref:Gfd2/YDR514C-like C-terminal domain-containing protein n=1 Tax=Plenodomus tracheiphilus IPT5 TaxID=1408161 RepID=A0A6A7B1S1_9PLEO|nr:hypothetical protein T440DRAFT_400911 [Plenodomus tracheiphilus IPT5]